MEAGVYVRGVRELMLNLQALGADVERASRDALWKAGALLEERLKRKLSHAGTGEEYSTGAKTGRYAKHRASASGEPPAVDTGRLRSSITHTVNKSISKQYSFKGGSDVTDLPDPGGTKDVARGYVGTNVRYGFFLEHGTVNVAERPWMFVTISENANEVAGTIKDSLEDAIKKAKKK